MSELKLYNVGPEEISEQDCKGFVWVVAWYETGDYCGSGQAISFDGKVYRHHNLGHCSCFGPEEGMGDGEPVELELIVGDNIATGYEFHEEIVSKVRELTAAMRSETTEHTE
jgi:hypothetical protein